MSRSLEKAGYVLLLFFITVLGLSGFMTPQQPPNVNSLHVPFTPQYASQWCWAATTSMVLQYEAKSNTNVVPLSQSQYVKAVCLLWNYSVSDLWMLDTLPLTDSGLSLFNFDGNPFYDSVGHNFIQTAATESRQSQDPLTFEQLQAEFVAGRPVIFGWGIWGLTDSTNAFSGAHFLVAEGTPHSSYYNGRHGWVSIHDPEPVGRGCHSIMMYFEYANKRPMYDPDFMWYSYNLHYYDIYNITYTGK